MSDKSARQPSKAPPARQKTAPSRPDDDDLRWRARPDLVAASVLIILAAGGYATAERLISIWGLMGITFLLMVALSGLTWRESIGRRSTVRAGSASSHSAARVEGGIVSKEVTAPPSPGSAAHEIDLIGLRLAIGDAGREGSKTLVVSARLNVETLGFVVLNSANPDVEDDLRAVLHQVFDKSSTPHRAGARLLHVLEKQGGLNSAFVGIWYPLPRLLAYVSAGLEDALAFKDTPGRLWDLPSWRSRPQAHKVLMGLHRLAMDERWLFYTHPLIEVPNPMAHPFNRISIVQHAAADRAMPLARWVDYLLRRAATAHGGSLPGRAMMLALACEHPRALTFADRPAADGVLSAIRSGSGKRELSGLGRARGRENEAEAGRHVFIE